MLLLSLNFFLYTLIDSLIDKYFPITDRLEDRIEELEDDMYDHPAKEITEEFLDLKKTILTMRRSILSQKKIFASVNGKYAFNIHEDNIPYYLDLLDHIEQIIESTEGFSSLVEGALATYYSVISARTNETMRVLTVISTIFMPLTFVTGFFGMNVPLPGNENIMSTLLITISLLAVSLYMYMIFRWNKWL
ncbi:MAG: magnesium transporter CorA family protein [Clostridia bacterium]|nr:magnesium transporter CorA family protein [Clostridia bacterium]